MLWQFKALYKFAVHANVNLRKGSINKNIDSVKPL